MRFKSSSRLGLNEKSFEKKSGSIGESPKWNPTVVTGIWEFSVAPPQSGYSSIEIWIELDFGNVGFRGEGKTGVPGEKPPGAEKRTNCNNKLNPHIASSPRNDPEPNQCEASALTTEPSLLPRRELVLQKTLNGI